MVQQHVGVLLQQVGDSGNVDKIEKSGPRGPRKLCMSYHWPIWWKKEQLSLLLESKGGGESCIEKGRVSGSMWTALCSVHCGTDSEVTGSPLHETRLLCMTLTCCFCQSVKDN